MNTEELLRRALEAEASTVEVRPDALDTIRERIARKRRTRWVPPAWTTLAAAATAAAVAVGVATCAPPVPPQRVQPGATASADVTASPAPTARVPVYYLGAAGRLYREYHLVPGSADPVRAAVELVLRGAAADPDYATGWPSGVRLRDARVDGQVVTVDLAGLSGRTVTGQAVQQLVWTVTAVSGQPQVRVLVDGGPAGFAPGTQRRGPALEVLAPVWLIEPQAGSTITGDLPVHVDGAVHEATVQVRVRAGDRVVFQQAVTLSRGAPQRGEAKLAVPVPPGAYTVEAYEISPADGSERYLDGHDVTVR